MKKNTLMLYVLAGLMLACSVCLTRADIPSFIYTFPGGANQFVATNFYGANYNPPPYTVRNDYTNPTTFFGVAWTNVLWSPTNDEPYYPGSGSAEFVFSNINSSATYIYTNPGPTYTTSYAASVAYTMDLFNANAGSNTQVSAVGFDIMVAPGSATDSSNGYGTFTVNIRDASYNFPTNSSTFTNYSEELGNPSGTNNLAGTWEHILITGTNGMPSAAQPAGAGSGGLCQTNRIRAITWTWNWPNDGLNGSVTCYIDNLVIYTNGTLTSPTMSISKYTGLKGVVNLITTPNATVNGGNPYAEKQDLEVIPVTNSWVKSPSTTYALTITNYPSPAYSNFQSYIFIAGNATNTSVPTEPNPDWAEADCMYFQIMNNADGSAYAQLLWKVLNPAGNDMYSGANGYYTGFVGSVTCPATNGGPLGTWSMTFANNTNVTLTAPNGTTYVTNIPYSSTDIPVYGSSSFIGHGVIDFNIPVGIWFGCEPNQPNTNNPSGNIGQGAYYSQFQIISNGITVFSDNFGGNSLNLTNWRVTAEDPNGIVQIPANAAYLLTWTLPDLGFALTSTNNPAGTNSWIGTTPAIQPFPYNGLREGYAPNTNVALYKLVYTPSHH